MTDADAELQQEEREVLTSIYDGDPAFKETSPNIFQYKFGDNEDVKSFLLEISWGPTYPTEKPAVNMDTFYNRNLLASVKNKIIEMVNEEANQWLGCAMTYTLFEFVKERATELLEEQTQAAPVQVVTDDISKVSLDEGNQDEAKRGPKKEQLTKAQKRKAWDRAEGGKGGEKPRGYDWVDIVKHLSQAPNPNQKAVASS